MSDRVTTKELRLRAANEEATWPNTLEGYNSANLCRIASSLELIANSYADLIRQREYYERAYRNEAFRRESLERRVSAMRGVVTRMKKKLGGAK